MPIALIAFGSNVQPERHLPRALTLIATRTRILSISPVYETPPVEAEGTPSFLNGVLRAEVTLSPEPLRRDLLRSIERELGRIRSDDPNAPRPIDLDLLEHDGTLFEDPAAHAHVAIPLADLAPDWIHPATRTPILEIAARFARERALFRRRPDVEALLPG